MTPTTRTLSLTLLLLAGVTAGANAQQRPPTGRKLDELVVKFLAADDRTEAGQAERRAILERVATVPPLKQRDVDKWKKKLEKLWRKGKQLEQTGDNRLFEDGTGRYIVGGNTKKPKGLAIAMHGGGVGSGDAGPAAASYGPALDQLGLLMIAPQVLQATERGWTDSGSEQFVLELVDCALRTWKIDPDKVFFVGHSMGGYGSWTLGAHHADRVAAVAPSAGAPTPIRERRGGPIVDLVEGVIPSLRNVYVSIYQSIDDAQVPPEPNQFAARELIRARKKWGAFEHDYWEVDGQGHGAPPGGYLAQLQKIADKTRNAVPERIVWQPVLDWKHQFYWLYWDKPAANAIVVADLDRTGNAVTITSDQPCDGLYVLLDPRVLDLTKEVVVTLNGSETFRGTVEQRLETLVLTSRHPDPKLQFTARVKAH